MAKDPAFLFYPQDFFLGVSTMEFADRGKYITILCVMHQQGRLKEESIRLLVGSVSDTLRLKFKVDKNGLWFNERLEEEVEKRKKFTESRKINGSKGGRPKRTKPSVKPSGLASENLVEDVNEDVNNNKDSIINLWIRTLGRNPNIPEYEETENFIKKYGYEQAYQTYKAASLRSIKSLSYLMSNIDSKGCLIPYEVKAKNTKKELTGYDAY